MKKTIQKLKGLFVHVINPSQKEPALSPEEIKARIKKRVKINHDQNPSDRKPKP